MKKNRNAVSNNDNKFDSVVLGSFSQSDSQFGQSAGVQCTAISVYACIYTEIKLIHSWDSGTIDNLLIQGDILYNKTFQPLALAGRVDRYLSADELPALIWVGGKEFSVHYTLHCAQGATPALSGSKFTEIELGLFFEKFFCGVITFAGRSVALMRFANGAGIQCFAIFDSHSVDQFGNIAAKGLACLMTFTSLG